MRLIFHDAQAGPFVPPGEALLTVEQKGTISLSIAAVAQLGLVPGAKLIPVQDADTNTWYLLPSPPAAHKPFTLRKRDKSSKALMFCSTPRARAYYAAHGLKEEKSVRALVAATPIEHEGLRLYPLTPQHPTLAPVSPVALVEAPVEEKSWVRPAAVTAVPTTEPAAVANAQQEAQPTAAPTEAGVEADSASARQESPFTAEMDAALLAEGSSPALLSREWNMDRQKVANRKTYLKQRPQAAPATTTLVYTPAPGSAPVQKTYGLQARAEELANYWLEREIHRTTPNELAEILNLMRHIPESKRGIEMTLVLNRAEAEHTSRLTAAGKGGKRG